MATADRTRWDARYRSAAPLNEARLPTAFASCADELAGCATAIELACGVGSLSVWLAVQGVAITGYDVSVVAIEQATDLAALAGVDDRCRFEVADFDDGLPPGDPVELVVSHLFRDARLDRAIIDRLAPGAILAIAALSEVGGTPGRFRAKPGELARAFAALDLIAQDEAEGVAWLIARKPELAPAG